MGSILLVGAPSRQALSRTWTRDYLTSDLHDAPLDLAPQHGVTLWRRLDMPDMEADVDGDVAEDAMSTSFSLYVAPDDSGADGNTTVLGRAAEHRSFESVALPTQLPAFSFDMAAVLDVEDLYDQPLADRNGRQSTHSVLAAVLSISETRPITTRGGDQTEVVVLTLGDATSNGLEMAAWGAHARYVAATLRRLDVVLVEDFVLSSFNGVLGATSRQGRTRFSVLYRTDRRTREDDRLRPLLQEDLQSRRVRAVRDWVLTWVPSDTQPLDMSM